MQELNVVTVRSRFLWQVYPEGLFASMRKPLFMAELRPSRTRVYH